MYLSITMAKSLMSEQDLKDAIAFQREQERLEANPPPETDDSNAPSLEDKYEAGGFAALFSSSNHKPNLLNTIVFLVETAQQVAVMLVNYKGRPWMRGATENPGLLYSLVACAAGVIVAAWELIPQLNSTLGLVPLPSDEMRYKLLSILAVTLVGSFVWDRLCLAIFAPHIFMSQIRELASLRFSDFWGPNSAKTLGQVALAGFWLYYTEGNMLVAGAGYWFYRSFKKKQEAAVAAAAGGGAAAAQ